MKTAIVSLTLIIISFIVFSFTLSDNTTLCKVNKYNGKYAFWFSEPVSEYDEVFTVKTKLNQQFSLWKIRVNFTSAELGITFSTLFFYKDSDLLGLKFAFSTPESGIFVEK